MSPMFPCLSYPFYSFKCCCCLNSMKLNQTGSSEVFYLETSMLHLGQPIGFSFLLFHILNIFYWILSSTFMPFLKMFYSLRICCVHLYVTFMHYANQNGFVHIGQKYIHSTALSSLIDSDITSALKMICSCVPVNTQHLFCGREAVQSSSPAALSLTEPGNK